MDAGDCATSTTELGGPFGEFFNFARGAHSGEHAVLLGEWAVDDEGSGFEYPDFELCY